MKPKNFPERKNIKRKLAWNILVSRFGKEIADNSFEENVEKCANDQKLVNYGERIAIEIKSLKNSISEESLRSSRTKIFRGQ